MTIGISVYLTFPSISNTNLLNLAAILRNREQTLEGKYHFGIIFINAQYSKSEVLKKKIIFGMYNPYLNRRTFNGYCICNKKA